jgi:hypothetical protein
MSDFRTVLVKDSTLADITPDLTYAVRSGAASTTYQNFQATSAGNSVIVMQVQVPSENIVVGRDALITTPMQFRINLGSAAVPAALAAGVVAIQWGKSAALQAYPLASIMTTASASINNTTTSCNLQDILPQLLRLNDNRELFRYNGMCPTLPDQEFGVYADADGANCSPLAGVANKSYDGDLTPRGAFPCIAVINRYIAGVRQDSSPVSTGVDNHWIITVFTTTTEPIFLSPFIYGDPDHNKQGLVGVNNMSFTFNMNTTLNRLVSYGGPVAPALITLQPGVDASPAGSPIAWAAESNMFASLVFPNANRDLNARTCAILLRLLSSQPSDRLQTRNVVPYYDLPRYLTNATSAANIAANTVASISSQAIQLSQLPDYFIIVARKTMATQTIADTASFLTIRSISLNLNNASGLLSSASPEDLWRISVKNGSQQSFSEFCGKAFAFTAGGVGVPQGKLVPTTGSLFVVSPTDLSLPDMLAPGSLGAFSLQFTAQVFNQFDAAAPAQVELCVIACNSGIMTLSQGTASLYTGLLTREAVLAAKQQEPSDEGSRMIGGRVGMLSRALARHPRMVSAVRSYMKGGVPSAGSMSAGRLSGMY